MRLGVPKKEEQQETSHVQLGSGNPTFDPSAKPNSFLVKKLQADPMNYPEHNYGGAEIGNEDRSNV